jgi:hypothetical protein
MVSLGNQFPGFYHFSEKKTTKMMSNLDKNKNNRSFTFQIHLLKRSPTTDLAQ